MPSPSVATAPWPTCTLNAGSGPASLQGHVGLPAPVSPCGGGVGTVQGVREGGVRGGAPRVHMCRGGGGSAPWAGGWHMCMHAPHCTSLHAFPAPPCSATHMCRLPSLASLSGHPAPPYHAQPCPLLICPSWHT